MTWIAALRSRRDVPRTRALADAYTSAGTGAEQEAVQLALLNETWERAAATVPWWARQVAEGGLPRRFESLAEFVARVPPLDRSGLQARREQLVSSERPAERVRITGGSTAEPVQIPSWSSEFHRLTPDMWMARAWYGIRPDARLFLLWGHSHLLGQGWRGWLNARRREVDDRLLGYRRFSAYDLSPENLRRAAREIERFRPELICGYSVALDLFARANADRRESLRAAGTRLVLAAAEAFPAPDSAERLSELFGCPVGMEYGAVETGLVGHTHPDGGYRVFWRSYLVDAERVGAHHRVRVTSLYPRCVPLLRYELGDEIELGPDAADRVIGLRAFSRVIGRCNDYALLRDGLAIHSEAFTHAVRSCAAVRAYQVVQQGDDIRLLYTADRALARDEEQGIRMRLGRIHSELAGVPFDHVAELRRTIAGKTPMVVRR